MRNRTISTLVLFGIIFGIASAAYVNDKEKLQRAPASENRKPLWMPAPVGKHLALLRVEIETPHFIPDSGTDAVEIAGRILINQKIKGDLSYAWSLPDDVSVVDGQVSDSLSGVQVGQIVEVNLIVSGFNREKQRLIALQASGHQNGEVLGNSAIIASRPEDTWEAVAPDMKKAADEQLGPVSRARRGR